ncbi:hypothetical protein C8Q80DRAFT_1121026 [Daedaleopsis nitida]|nr:hypothetical protein C8Q80DRAFT_1121026 [Daedaleopsis nitida]
MALLSKVNPSLVCDSSSATPSPISIHILFLSLSTKRPSLLPSQAHISDIPFADVFIALNAIRIVNIVALALVFASNVLLLVHDGRAIAHTVAASGIDSSDCDYIDGSTVPNQPAGAFWAVLHRLLVLVQLPLLLLSELARLPALFRTYLPVLGPDAGLAPLGACEIVLAAGVLAHRVDRFALAAAFLLAAVGGVNALLLGGCGVRARRMREWRAWREWRDEARGVLPPPVRRDWRER